MLVCWALLAPATRAAAVDVGADDGTDRFVGSATVPGSPAGGHPGGSACADCVWMLADPCSSQFNALGCGTVTDGCPTGGEQRRQWLSVDGGLTWEDRGLRCVDSRRQQALDPGSPALHEAFARSLPAVHVGVQPVVGVLPQVPTLFDSGQPAAVAASMHEVAGSRIELRPVARWHWDFGDGGALDTSSPGSAYPDLTVAHTYRLSGAYRVRVVTTWTATYLVDGSGPYAVDGEVHQEAERTIRVGQGRAVLLPTG